MHILDSPKHFYLLPIQPTYPINKYLGRKIFVIIRKDSKTNKKLRISHETTNSKIKRIVTRKVSFWFGIFFYIFFCTCHCFWMQKLSFVPKNEFIPDVQFRVIANLLFLAFFDNFCSNCPRMICIDARTMTSISGSSV